MTVDELSELARPEQPVESGVDFFFAWSNAHSFVVDVRRVEAASVCIQAPLDEIRDLTFNTGRTQGSISTIVVAIRAARVHWQSLGHSVGLRQPSNKSIN